MLRWPKIVEELKKVGIYYEERQVYRLHGDALNAARDLWNQRKGEQHEF
jgi:hypothetical protein